MSAKDIERDNIGIPKSNILVDTSDRCLWTRFTESTPFYGINVKKSDSCVFGSNLVVARDGWSSSYNRIFWTVKSPWESAGTTTRNFLVGESTYNSGFVRDISITPGVSNVNLYYIYRHSSATAEFYYEIMHLGSTDLITWGNSQRIYGVTVINTETAPAPRYISGIGSTALYCLISGATVEIPNPITGGVRQDYALRLGKFMHNGASWTGLTYLGVADYVEMDWSQTAPKLSALGISGNNYICITATSLDKYVGAVPHLLIDDQKNINYVRSPISDNYDDNYTEVVDRILTKLPTYWDKDYKNIDYATLSFGNNRFYLLYKKMALAEGIADEYNIRYYGQYLTVFSSSDFIHWNRSVVGTTLRAVPGGVVDYGFGRNDCFRLHIGVSDANVQYITTFNKGTGTGLDVHRSFNSGSTVSVTSNVSSLSSDNNATMRLELSNTGVY